MNKTGVPEFDKARNYAFRLLKFRMRSQEELLQRLKRKGFGSAIIEKVIAFLKEKEFIDDKEFARLWVEDKIKRPLGLRRIRQELKIKGIDKEIIERVLRERKTNYDEEGIIRSLVQHRLERLKGLDLQRKRSRLYSYLLRRGFSPEAVLNVLAQF